MSTSNLKGEFFSADGQISLFSIRNVPSLDRIVAGTSSTGRLATASDTKCKFVNAEFKQYMYEKKREYQHYPTGKTP